MRSAGPARRRRTRRRRLPAIVGLGLLAACRGPTPDWQEQRLAASEAPFGLAWSAVDPALSEHVLRRDPRSSNQLYLSRFIGADAVAVLAALETGPSYVVEERATESYVAELLEKAEPAWGESGRAPSRLGSVPYRTFRIAADSLSCVGFGQPIGAAADDRGRRRDLVFGYFCRVDDQPLSSATAQELIGKIAFSDRR